MPARDQTSGYNKFNSSAAYAMFKHDTYIGKL